MRRVAIPLIAGLVVAACGSDDEATGAMAVVETELDAMADGDAEKAAGTWAADAVLVFPDGFEVEVWAHSGGFMPVQDYDGDGTPSMADFAQTDIALTDAFDKTLDYDCTEISETVVECTEYVTDVFSRAAGLEDPGLSYRSTVEGNQIVRREMIEPPAGMEAAESFGLAVQDEVRAYEQWIFDNYREMHPKMFQGSCCTTNIATTTESVELHEEMMPEYQQTLEA